MKGWMEGLKDHDSCHTHADRLVNSCNPRAKPRNSRVLNDLSSSNTCTTSNTALGHNEF